jgi:hypothetical protein
VGPRVCDEKGQKNNGEKERAGDVIWTMEGLSERKGESKVKPWVLEKVMPGTTQVYSVLFVALDRRYTCLHCVARGAPLGKEKYLASYIFKRGGRPNRYLCFFFFLRLIFLWF